MPPIEGVNIFLGVDFLPFAVLLHACTKIDLNSIKNRNGVTDRTRTGDNQNHNLGLYQLSYDHRWRRGLYQPWEGGSIFNFHGSIFKRGSRISKGARFLECGGKRSATPLFGRPESAVAASLCRRTPYWFLRLEPSLRIGTFPPPSVHNSAWTLGGGGGMMVR